LPGLRKLLQRLGLALTYTYSHAIDDASPPASGGMAGRRLWCRRTGKTFWRRVQFTFDIRHNLNATSAKNFPSCPMPLSTSGNGLSHGLANVLCRAVCFATGEPLTRAIMPKRRIWARGSTVSRDRTGGRGFADGRRGSLDHWFNTRRSQRLRAGAGVWTRRRVVGGPGPGTLTVDASLRDDH